MDWYDRLEHEPGCNLAFLREFVDSDTICSCYQSVLDRWPEPRRTWLDEFVSMTWTAIQNRVKVIPYHSTGEIKLKATPRGSTFGFHT